MISTKRLALIFLIVLPSSCTLQRNTLPEAIDPTSNVTPTPPGETASPPLDDEARALIQLLDLDAPSSTVRVVRHDAGFFSFEIPPGWEIFTLQQDDFLVKQIDTDVFGGIYSQQPYIYFRTQPRSTELSLEESLQTMRSSLAGVERAEPPLSPHLAGIDGLGQFVIGRIGDAAQPIKYRAYLLVVRLPEADTLIQMVFWGAEASWPDTAQRMALILESIIWHERNPYDRPTKP